MQKISLQKKSFFNSIGLNVENLPAELQIKSNSIQTKIPRENLKFLNNPDLTIPKEKYFRLKNLYGTIDLKLDNKTWIEIFSDSEKTDEIVRLYFKNPNYYIKDLKKVNKTENSGNIELLEDNGKFFVKDGIARLALVMIKYLLEMSRADSKEEKLMINKQYTYSAVVRSLPKDTDIIYLVNMLFEIYGSKLKMKKVDNDNESNYILKYEDKKIEITSKKELENFIKNSYLPKEYKNEDSLKKRLDNMAKIGLSYKENEESVDLFLVMGKIFPNYEMFIKYYKKICQYGIEDKITDKIDLENVTYDVILKKMIKLVKQKELEANKTEKKASAKEANTIKKQVQYESVSKVVPIKESKKKTSVREPVQSASTQKVVKVQANKADAEEDVNEIIKKAKELADSQIKNIADNIEMTYYKLKTEESNIIDLSNRTNVELNIDRINDDAINSNINSIKQGSFVLRKKVESADAIDNLNYTNELLKDLKRISDDKSVTMEYGEEMKSIYTVCFNKNAQKMITDAKLKKLDKQRKEIESEKCSFFSKLIGKAKLKQAKLDNINLKEQLILTESQFSSNSYYTIEDGLSDMYAYIKTEDDESCLTDVKMYLRNLESNSQIKGMTDQLKLSKKTKEKIEQQRNLPQLVLGKEKRKLFSKAQINMVQEKNNELKRVIQINRANSLKLQNTGVIPIIGNIKTTKAVKRFINNLNQIDSTIKSQGC
ncbi:MAG: hypothetical protein IKE01_02895 [Clostridia bacterium]|nr:hypothetical protein [Clostridia bacterium]